MLNRDLMAGIGSGLSAEITATSPNPNISDPSNYYFKKGGSNHSVSNFANDFTTSLNRRKLIGLGVMVGCE